MSRGPRQNRKWDFNLWREQMGKILAGDEKKEICEEKMVDKLCVHFRPVWISARASGITTREGGQMGMYRSLLKRNFQKKEFSMSFWMIMAKKAWNNLFTCSLLNEIENWE